MKSNKLKKIMIIALAFLSGSSVSAESLFRLGISQSTHPMQPKSLYSTVKARTIGDVIVVNVEEDASVTNDVSLSIKNASEAEDNFTGTIEKIVNHNFLPTNFDGFGGSSQTKNTANVTRVLRLKDTITAQVVQVLPNGNLVIQGRKIAMNSGEKTQVIISGIVDPRLINNSGQISSNLVANLQLAVVGRGTVSRAEQEGPINRFFGQLF